MEIKTLFGKYLNDELSPGELAQLRVLLDNNANLEELGHFIEAVLREQRFSEKAEFDKQAMIGAILQEMPAYRKPVETTAPSVRVRFFDRRLPRYAAAVLLLLATGAGVWYGLAGRHRELATASSAPGANEPLANRGNIAVLTLANGMKISLDSAGNGSLACQAGINVLKLDAGRLAYSAGGKSSNEAAGKLSATSEVAYNTITTPRGGQYEVSLQDGSKIWLNAASSLRFPVSFEGTDRHVDITGEAYFEIAKDSRRPFTVSVREVTVEVLGTSFDLNAYTDEGAVRTTLLEGGVRVSTSSFRTVLKPGEQASVGEAGVTGGPGAADAPGGAADVRKVNTDQVVAWKNGYFEFDDAPIEAIMRQLARWYGLDVRYQGKVNKGFLATIPRTADIAQVFRVLAYTGAVHFDIEGNRVTVKP